ncbi:RuBisCO large subunit C-terminal-like domain-containing protein [Ornithinimicrobium cerasi]|uniref:RuBisCO large subunit C-terminal-like domain-containing protein n=1 Tax=Ornithinimicrobium cerasi TaxID=2248773 RepID=UPI001F018255|nr:RuBisCO large subunit C-terminal-like domain-containing protein [Ornithinimicrobium cerasi]
MFTATYAIETDVGLERAAQVLAGEQSSGTFLPVPGESDRLRERHGAQVVAVTDLGEVEPSLPNRHRPDRVRAGEIEIEFPLENVHDDLATLWTVVGGNLFELRELFACRLTDLRLPDELVRGFPGPGFGLEETRHLVGRPDGVLVGTIVKPNVGLDEEGFRQVVRQLGGSGIDLIKDDELMTDPAYLPLETRVRVVREELGDAADRTGHRTMYAFNITGDLAGLQRRHDIVVNGGGNCVMLTVPAMGLPALQWLRSFASVPIHAHRAGLAASMRHPSLGISYTAWQIFARLAGADHLHASGLGSKFYERDEEVVHNVTALLQPLGSTRRPLPTLSSGQNVYAPRPTWDALGTTDLMMLAGGGVMAHPESPEAGVRSLRQAWDAAIAGTDLQTAAQDLADHGDTALLAAARQFDTRAHA